MSYKLIKNGKVVTENNTKIQDILINGEKIEEIGTVLSFPEAEVIDANGKIVIPGGIDVHTHLNLCAGPYTAEDDFYTGTVAAACGGTTTIVDHMGFGPKGCNLMHQVEKYHEYADDNAVIDYGFHGVFQHVNDDILNEIPKLVELGITSFKAYLVYDYALNDYEILKIMRKTKESGVLLTVHCENDGIIKFNKARFLAENKTSAYYHYLSRDENCESEAVNRMIALSKTAGDAPLYLVHLSSGRSIDHVRAVHQQENSVFAETCPQYLFLDSELYKKKDGIKYILSPSLKQKYNQKILWDGLADGNISVVGTDHCPFNLSLRKKVSDDNFSKCPNGLPGLENRIPLLFSEGVGKGRISLEKFVDINCTNPAKMMGLYPKKGVIKKGSDADIVIMDPDKKVTISNSILHQNVDYTPFEGFNVTGYPIMTISKGKVIAKNNKFIGKKGNGKYLTRDQFNYNR